MVKQQVGTVDGQDVWCLTLENDCMAVRLLSFGAVLQNLWLKGADDSRTDVVLGFDDWHSYINQGFYLGCVVGRCCNRIAGGTFSLNGHAVQLDQNEGANHLHGGAHGFWNLPWELQTATDTSVTFRLHSPDGDAGYPGALDAEICYTLEKDGLHLRYTATPDADTIVSLTNHSYFNLAGHGDCGGQEVAVYADAFAEIDAQCGSTGRILPVEHSPFDLREGAELRTRWADTADEQMVRGSGFNHNYVLGAGVGLRLAAQVREPDSGRVMQVWTDCPGMHFYTGNYLNGSFAGKNDVCYQRFGGICFETQTHPDAIHFPQFPTPIVRAGEVWRRETVFRFPAASAGDV